jgi:hypothetical protein
MYTFRGVGHAGTLDRATASSMEAANNIGCNIFAKCEREHEERNLGK